MWTVQLHAHTYGCVTWGGPQARFPCAAAPAAQCAGFQAVLRYLSCTRACVLQKLCDWLNASNKTCTAFDFPTKGILQEAIKKNELWRLKDSKGKPPGLMGW